LVSSLQEDVRISRRYAPWLWVLLTLFCFRVLGQLLVALFSVTLLPPMEEWFSGTLTYRPLLASQLLIILLYGKVALDFTCCRGFFTRRSRRLGDGLLLFGSLYLGVMLIRYTIRMSLYPHERWTGGSIPIFFHWVLASFLLVVAHFHRRYAGETLRPSRGWTAKVLRAAGAVMISVAVLAWVGYQLAPWWFGRVLNLRPTEFAVRSERAAMTTPDGTTLVANIYHPRRAGKSPTILVRLPYSKSLTNVFFSDIVGRMWGEHGYTAVFQGARGRYESGGEYYPLRDERQDGIQTLAWLSRQPWFDGRLGTWGGSAFPQWVLADQAKPGPSALLIWLASSNFHDMFYSGGAFSFESALFWALRSHGRDDDPPSAETLDRGQKGWPLRDAERRATGQKIPFFQDWLQHPDKDAYWSQTDSANRITQLKAPVLLMGGWFDPFLPAQLRDFDRIRRAADLRIGSATRLVVGPWAHAWTPRLPGGFQPRNFRIESLAPSVQWFDQFLCAPGARLKEFPSVRLFVMGANAWRDEIAWPLARAVPTSYYLHRGRSLATEPPRSDEEPDTYFYDPQHPVPTSGGAMLGPLAGVMQQNDVESRDDVLVYTTPPLERDLEVTGPLRLILYVSTSATNTDFTGKLVDVYPDGTAYNVSDGILRQPYGAARAQIEVDLASTSLLFFRGHRIRLEVSSSNFPRFDRNPNTGGDVASETRPIAARQKVYHGPDAKSRLILPVVPQ